MAVGERCPACGHMPGEVDLTTNQRAMLVQWAIDLTKASNPPGGESAEQVAVRLATLHGALMGLTFAKTTDEPAA